MSATLLHPHASHHGLHGHGFFGHIHDMVATWRERSRTRARLADLDDHMLRDIGLNPEMVDREIRKPFWRD